MTLRIPLFSRILIWLLLNLLILGALLGSSCGPSSVGNRC